LRDPDKAAALENWLRQLSAVLIGTLGKANYDTSLCCIINTFLADIMEVDLVPPHSEIASLSNQSGIESCRGRFTDLSRRPKRLPMHSSSKVQTKFGASRPLTQRKAIYLASRHIGIACQMDIAASISIHPSAPPRVEGVLLTHVGISELLALFKEQMPLEQFVPPFRCRDSLTGSPRPIDRTIR
jgi:hypothetical protein